MSLFRVDKDKCIQCGICALGCARMVIQMDENKYPVLPQKDEYYCMECGHCVINCPPGAIHLRDFGAADAPDLKGVQSPCFEEAAKLLSTMRSTRVFKSDAVSHVTMEKLLDIARYAPTGSNRQAIRYVAVEGNRLAAFKDLYLKKIHEGVTNPGRHSRMDEQQVQGKDRVFRGAPLLVVALFPKELEFIEDVPIALTYLVIAAHAAGLGSFWSGMVIRLLRRDAESRDFLGMQEGETVGGALLMGYRKLPLSNLLPQRKPADITWLD